MYGLAAKDAMITVNYDLARSIIYLSPPKPGVLIRLSFLWH
jgi:hypothetical protein